MKAHVILLALCCFISSLTRPAGAQQLAPATDVLLLTSGQELRGRVLTITPTELTYLPAADTAQARPDTLRLLVASVFLVRYANGTREVLAPATPPADPTPVALRNLSAGQRQQRGQQDALRSYRASGPYWGAFGSTLYLGPLFGLAPTLGISSSTVGEAKLQAPEPALLRDANYAAGYQQQANRTKRRRAWGGYGMATSLYIVLVGMLLANANN